MNYDVLHNFISPITGRVPLIKDYILIGAANNFSIMSPKLIDMQLDIIDIRHDFDNLIKSSFIVGFPNKQLSNSQVLSSLADGFVFNTAGIISTRNLSLAPTNATYILQTPDNNLPNSQALSSISGLFGGILKCNGLGVVSIASGGSIPLFNDYVTPANLAEEKAERIGSDSAIETALVVLEAEIEAEIAALAGVVGLDILGTILGFIGVAAGGKAYGDYIRGQTLNVKNTWKAADLNDEGHNAVGDFEFRFPSGYSSDDRGHGTLWFDSTGRGNENKSEAGLRLFSWDSGGDHIGFDDPIAPLHIGLFGYQNKYNIWPFPNPTAKYKGFIFSIPDFHNESSSNDNYRFPKKFGLYDVTRTIGTWTSNKYGWDSKNTIFEYDYTDFSFYKNVKFNNYTSFEESVDFKKDVNFLSKGAIKLPAGTIAERPITARLGMERYNTELSTPEYYTGSSWKSYGTVTYINITGSTGLFITGSPITSSGAISLTLGSELQALSAFIYTGLMVRTGSGSYVGRTLIGGTGISITNGNGILDNPTISVSTIDINTNTTGSLPIYRLAGYNIAPTTTFLKGDGNWSLVDINTNTTGSLLPSRISGYPSNSTLFLNGLGSWTTPAFPNLMTTSAITYSLTINNTNTSAISTHLLIQKNGVDASSFGFNSFTNEAYVWAYGTASLKFGTSNTMRMQILNNGTLDLTTNNLITSGSVSATTGTLKGNNLATHNSSSISVLNSLDMTGNKIIGLGNPINNQDAATKFYVDNYGSLANNTINVNTTGGFTNWLRRSNSTKTDTQVFGLTTFAFILENTTGESAGIAFDGITDTCTVWTAGDTGSYLNIQDEDEVNTRIAYVAATTGVWTTVSSSKRKHSIREKTNNNVLERFLQLSVKTYGYKYNSTNLSKKKKERIERKTNKMATGLVLEELFEIFPNCIPDYYNELFQEKDYNKKISLANEVKDIANCGIDYNTLLCYFIMAFQEFVQKTNNNILELKGRK